MTHRLATNYAKNYCNRTPIVKVIVENVVTCFFGGTQCRLSVDCGANYADSRDHAASTNWQGILTALNLYTILK